MSTQFINDLRAGKYDAISEQPKNSDISSQPKTSNSQFINDLRAGKYDAPEEQGFFSRVGDDLGNIGKAWKSGNMYSEGKWNDIAKGIIERKSPEELNQLYDAYKAWRTENPTPENKSWVGNVVNGVSALIPQTIDMIPEALKVGAATGGAGLALGSVTGPGSLATGAAGFKLGATASMVEQSLKIGMADTYTSLRDDGVDDDTARFWAVATSPIYGSAEYLGKAFGPVTRKFLGGKAIKELVDKVTDKAIKNKILNQAAKIGADATLTTLLESTTEGLQGGSVEGARQAAKGEGFSPKQIAQATWDEGVASIPAMGGMALLGLPIEGAINHARPKAETKETKAVKAAAEEGKKLLGTEENTNPYSPAPEAQIKPETPPQKKWNVGLGGDGKLQVTELESPLEADAKSDPYEAQPNVADVFKQQQEAYAAQEKAGNNAKTPSLVELARLQQLQTENAKAKQEAERIEAEKRQAEEKALAQAELEAEQESAEAPMPTKKKYKRLTESERALNAERAEARKIIDAIPDDDVSSKIDAISSYDVDALDDKDLEYASAQGYEWADKELAQRAKKAEEESHDSLLDVMERNGYRIPTPAAIKRHGGGSGLYGEVNDLYENMRAAGGKNFHYLQKFFRDQYVDLDDLANTLNSDEGFNFDGPADLLRELADNFSGTKTTRSNFSLTEDKAENKENSIWKDPLRRKFASTVRDNIELFKKEIEGKILNEEQQGIYDVSVGNNRIYRIKTDDLTTLGDFVTYLIGDRRKGAKKIMFKHFGENATGEVKAKEILRMGEIIRNNEPNIQGNMRTYEERASDGATLRVVVGKDKQQNNTIISFYSDKNRRFSLVSKPLTKQRELLHRKTEENPTDDVASDNNAESQAENKKNYSKKFKAVETATQQFYKNAKHKADVVVVNSHEALENAVGSKLPNVDALKAGDKVYLVADKLESPRKAVSKLFHEYVGHYGLQKLLGDDFKPFVAYIRNKYKGNEEFEKLKEKYQKARGSTNEKAEYEAAEELIAHLAEYRELSDPSLWKRLVARVQRALKRDGISDAYVKLLDEEILKDAVIASRQWSSGYLISNNNGKWQTRTAKEEPKDKKDNFSIKQNDAKRFNDSNPDMMFSFASERVNQAIEQADKEIDSEHESANKSAEAKREVAKNEFVKKYSNEYDEDTDEDILEYYVDELDGTPIRIFNGRYGGSIVEFQKDGKSLFATFDDSENSNYLYTYDTLEKAKKDQLEDAFEKENTDILDYQDNAFEDDEIDLKKRKFVRAIEKLGIKVADEQRARTGSEYIYLETPSGDRMKVRISDHNNTHHTDISIQNDWKEAVRYVESVYNDWNEGFNDWETVRFSLKDTPTEFKNTINSIVSEIKYIKDNNLATDQKSLEKRYAKYDSNGEKILDLKVAKLNENQVKYFGLKDPYIYTSLFDVLDHHFNHHQEVDEQVYYNLPNVISDADIVAKGTVENSYIFGKYLDKLHIATNVINIRRGKIFLYKNLYKTTDKNFFKDREIIKELSPSAARQPAIKADAKSTSTGVGNISRSQGDSLPLQSIENSKNQDNISKSEFNFSLADDSDTPNAKKNVFGPNAAQGDFDLNNIDLNDYEGMDTSHWSNADWDQACTDSYDLEYIINDLEETGNFDSKIYENIKGILQEGMPSSQVRLRLIEAIIPKFKKALHESRKEADKYFNLMREAVMDTYGENTLPNSLLVKTALQAFSEIDKQSFIFDVGMAIHIDDKTDYNSYDYYKHEAFVKMALDIVDDYRDISIVTEDFINNPLKKKLSSEILKKMIEAFNRNDDNKEFPVLENAIEDGLIFDKDLRNIVLASENEYVVASALFGLEKRDGGLSRAEARAINKRLKNGINTTDAFLALSRLINENCFYDKISEIKETLQNTFATWNKDFRDSLAQSIINTFRRENKNKLYSEDSRRRYARDLRDAAYFEALEKGDYQKARNIIKERQKESEYSTDVEHTSRANDIREFSLDPKFAKVYGEDAKAYGWGAYMTDDDRVSAHYRESLAKDKRSVEIQKKDGSYYNATTDQKTAIAMRTLFDSDEEYSEWLNKNFSKVDSKRYKTIIGKKWKIYDGKPVTYEISHKMKNNEMIVLDDSLKEQNPDVQKKFMEMIYGEVQNAYNQYGNFKRIVDRLFDFDDEGEIIENKSIKMNDARKLLEDDIRKDNDISEAEAQAKLSEMMQKYGIRGYKFKSGFGRNKKNVESWNYVSFDGGNALKRREVITRDEEGRIIPPSERFDSKNKDWNFSLTDDEIDEKHASLYERYKNGDQAAYQDAAELVAEEARRKGYEVKVYHGTGSSGFDVADASSKFEENGEGAQAHGKGLYLAVSKDTAEGYRKRSKPINVVRLGDKVIDYQKMGFPSLEDLIDEVYDLRDNYDLKSSPKHILNSLLSNLPYWERQAQEAREKIAQGDTGYEYNLEEAEEQINYINAYVEKLQKWVDAFGEGQTLSALDVHRGFGRVFDWFHNMKPDEILDQDKTIQEQPEILEKFKKAYEEDILPLLRDIYGADEGKFEGAVAKFDTNRTGAKILSAAKSLIGSGRFTQFLLKHGIRGTTYVGRKDGKVYTSFEGGATVKLQDPFTFNDNGELIPLSKRFDHTNPDMRFSLTDDEKQEKAREKAYKQKKARELITSKAGRALQAAVDMFAPLATLERVAYGKVRDAAQSAWKMALMTRNLDQVMFHVLRVGGIQYNKATGSFTTRKNIKGLEAILNPVKGKNYKNFENYAKAKSAFERWALLRKANPFAKVQFFDVFGFTIDEAKQWIKDGNEASKTAFQEIQEFFKGQRDFMLETGLISEKQHAKLSEFKNYVPFFREGKDLEKEAEEFYERYTEMFPGGKGFSGRNSGVKKFVGSKRKTKNLVENIVNQTRRVIDSGYKNIAIYRSLNLMRELDMATYVRSDSTDAKVKIAEMRRALEAEGIDVGDISDEDLLRKVPVEAYIDLTNDNNDNIVSVRVNGTLRFYKVEDPELLVAIKNFGAEKVNVLWKLLTSPKNVMTWAVTKTPAFAIRNFIRDTGSNTILFGGKTMAPYLGRTIKNIAKTAFNTDDMQKVWASGAGGGAWYSVKTDDIVLDFRNNKWDNDDNAWDKTKKVWYEGKKIGKYTIKPLSWLMEQYERRILMPSEQSNRMSVMQRALDNGASDMEAAFQAMDVMNFGMRGSGVWTGKNEWVKGPMTALHFIIRITPFLNARIQGLYKLWREGGVQEGRYKASEEFGIKNRTKAFVEGISKAVLLRGTMIASAAILYSLYANQSRDEDDEKWYEKLPAHDKLNYWHFYMGNNTILRIPKPFELGYIFATIPEALTDQLIQRRPQTAKVLWQGFTSQLGFDPMANPVLDTRREQISNKDSFSDRPIVQQSDKDLNPRYQYDPDTTASAKAIARAFEGVGLGRTWLASPARIQNVIGNFLGGMTKYIVGASDAVVESLTDFEGGTSRYAREGMLRSVYSWAIRNTKTMTTRNAEDYYELRNQVREIYGAARILRQEKRMEELQNLINNHKGELGNYNLIEAVNTRLNEIARKRRALGEDKGISTAELIRQDDELIAERNRILADVDILIDRVKNEDYKIRDLKEILNRISNVDKEKTDSKTAKTRLRELANMR